MEIWEKKYGPPQGKNLSRFADNYVIVKFFDKPQSYNVFLQFAYLDQKRRTTDEADTIAKQYLPKDAVVMETGKKQDIYQENRYFTETDTFESPTLKKVFGEGHIEVRKRIWIDEYSKPGISDIELAYVTVAEARMNADLVSRTEETVADTPNPEREKLLKLRESALQSNKNQLAQFRDFLSSAMQSILEEYNLQKTNEKKTEWINFTKLTHENIDEQRNEFLNVFVDIRVIPFEFIKYVMPISELFTLVDRSLINELTKDLDGKANEMSPLINEIETLFKSLTEEGL